MTIKDRVTQKVGPLPAWAWGVTAAGVIWVVMKMRGRNTVKDSEGETIAEDDPSANMYTLGPIASGGISPIASTPEWYINPPDWVNDVLTSDSEYNSILEQYLYDIQQSIADPALGGTAANPATDILTSAPGSGVTVQQSPAATKLMTWPQWNAYHSKLDKNWLKISGAVRQGRYYDYLRTHGATTLPGSGGAIPSTSAATATANTTANTPTPAAAKPSGTTAAQRAADRAKKGIMEFDAWVNYQVRANSKFMSQTTAEVRRDRWRAYVVAHGGQWQ